MPRRTEVVDHLAEVPLFAAASRGDLKIIARHLSEVDLAEGTVVCREGEAGDAFYVILAGEARVSRRAGAGERRVAVLGPGRWFGELALLDPAPRNATVTAVTMLRVGVMPARVFRAILRDVPALGERLLAGLARRLRETDRMVAEDVGRAPRTPRADRASPAATSRRQAAAGTPQQRTLHSQPDG